MKKVLTNVIEIEGILSLKRTIEASFEKGLNFLIVSIVILQEKKQLLMKDSGHR